MSGLKKVLIIDDDELVGLMIAQLLKKEHGIEVHYLSDPIKALSEIDKIRPDILLLDWVMPSMNGLDFLRSMREKNHVKDISVLMLSGKNKAEDVTHAKDYGIDGYFTKPINFKHLRSTVTAHLKAVA